MPSSYQLALWKQGIFSVKCAMVALGSSDARSEALVEKTQFEAQFFRLCFLILMLLTVSSIFRFTGLSIYIYPRYYLYWRRGYSGDVWFPLWWLASAAITSGLIYRALQGTRSCTKWISRVVSTGKVILIVAIAALAILISGSVWGENLRDWFLPVQIHHHQGPGE
jgi:hypothetical protein